jgi:hypothetical protein
LIATTKTSNYSAARLLAPVSGGLFFYYEPPITGDLLNGERHMRSDRNNPHQNKVNNTHQQVKTYDPVGWISTSDLEDELFHGIRAESLSSARVGGYGGDFAEIDDYFAGGDNETETEQRRSLLRLLGKVRPQLAELLGGTTTNDEK